MEQHRSWIYIYIYIFSSSLAFFFVTPTECYPFHLYLVLFQCYWGELPSPTAADFSLPWPKSTPKSFTFVCCGSEESPTIWNAVIMPFLCRCIYKYECEWVSEWMYDVQKEWHVFVCWGWCTHLWLEDKCICAQVKVDNKTVHSMDDDQTK